MSKSKIFFWASVSFIGGVALSSFLFFSTNLLFIIFAAATLLLAVFSRKSLWFWLGIFIIVFNIGVIRYQSKAQNFSIPFDREESVFEGIVIKPPSVRLNNTQLVLGHIDFKNTAAKIDKDFKILVFSTHYPEYQYGDKLLVRASLTKPQKLEGFDYPAYLAKDDVYLLGFKPSIEKIESNQGNIVKSWLFKIRSGFEQAVSQAIKEPQASFLNGLLLGVQEEMPPDVLSNFRKVGLTHIVALSGYNITIIASFLILIFSALTLTRAQSFWFTVAAIAAFVILTGAEASVVRAAVMGILVLLAQKEGRLYNVRNALTLAAAIMLVQNPRLLIFDVGFELSFLATLGLVYLAPRLKKLFAKIPNTLKLKDYLTTTLSAQFAVLPLILYRFEIFSLIAPLANILVLPIIPLTMLLGFLAAIAQLIFSWLGTVVGILSWVFLSWPIAVASKLASWSLASLSLGLNLFFVAIYSVVLWLWLKLTPEDDY